MKSHPLCTLYASMLLLGFAAAANLSNKYLPPNYAGSSGGYGGLLQGPKSAAQRPSNQYLVPQASNLHYHGVSGGGGRLGGARGFGGGVGGGAGAGAYGGGAQYGHNRAAAQIPILRSDYTNDGSGNYKFGFETGNGIRRDETGQFKGGWPHGSLDVAGSYSYTGDDGHVYTVNYKADGNGFHAEGDHLPTPPPIPPEIQESLALHRAAPSSGAAYGGGYSGGGGRGVGAGGGHGAGGYGSYPTYGGGHVGAASAPAPSNRYLPPQRRFRRRHY